MLLRTPQRFLAANVIGNFRKPMNILPRQIRKERHCFSSEKTIEEFLNNLNNIFSKSLDRNSSLTGKFTSEKEFIIVKRNLFTVFRNSIYYRNRIVGKVYSKDNETILDTIIRPHMRVYNLFICLIGLSLIFLILMFTNHDFFWTGIWILIVFSTTMTIVAVNAQASKNSLRKKFIEELELTEKSCL